MTTGEVAPPPLPPPAPRPRLSLRISLRTKVLAVVLFSVMVPLLTMGIYLLRMHEKVLDEKVRENLSFHLLRRTAQIESWSAERLQELGRWSTSFVLFEGVAGLTRPGGGAERTRRDVTEFLLSLKRYNAVYESLFVLDARGNLLAATNGEELDPWGRAFVAGERPPKEALSPVLESPRLGHPTMLAFHSIQDQGSETLGYLVGRIDLHELEHRLAPPSSDANVLFWLLDRDGRFVARAGKMLPAPGRERFGFPLNGAGNSDASRTVGPASLPGLAGPAFYISRAIEGPLQGTLVATLPVSVAYRTLDDSRGRLLAYSLSFLLLVFFLTYFVTRQLLLPIRRLSAGALRMGAGDLDVQLPESGHDEITDLTRVFNEMARRVREGLQRVEEARDALAHSNEELTGANKILGRLAITDGLTGLYNHRHFHDSLRRELLLAERESAQMALLMIDLDSFKAYNDRWGHTAGDAALRCVARALKEGLRESDLAFRYGGEELAALLPGCDKERGSVVAEKLRSAIRALPCPGHQPGAIVTVSIGVAAYPEDSTEPHQLLELADAALYAAKRDGRDRVVAAPDAEAARVPSSRS